MKSLFALVLWLTGGMLSLAAQDAFPIDADTKKITYTEVVTLAKVKKSELRKRAQTWATTAGCAAANQQPVDAYKCKGKFNLTYPSITAGKTDKGTVTYVATVYCKDGKYKYILTDFAHQGMYGRGDGGKLKNETPECGKFIMNVASWNKIKEKTRAEIPMILASLKAEMEKKPVLAKKKENDF